jgi:hypothetical protein
MLSGGGDFDGRDDPADPILWLARRTPRELALKATSARGSPLWNVAWSPSDGRDPIPRNERRAVVGEVDEDEGAVPSSRRRLPRRLHRLYERPASSDDGAKSPS